MKINGIGAGLWITQKVELVSTAYDMYQVTQSNDALLELATKPVSWSQELL